MNKNLCGNIVKIVRKRKGTATARTTEQCQKIQSKIMTNISIYVCEMDERNIPPPTFYQYTNPRTKMPPEIAL